MRRLDEQAARRIAAGQRTLVTTDQLGKCGLDKDAVAYRVQGAILHLVFPRVYSFGCGELPPLAREQAALLSVGPKSFLSHRSAAFLWGMLKNPPEPVELSVVGRQCRSRNGICVHRINTIDRREVVRKDGLWASTPARAALEVAASAPEELVDVLDEGLAHRVLNRRELEAVLARDRPCRGAARLAALLGDETAMRITRSRAEKAFLRLIRDARLPLPETNVPFGGYEADFLWRRERLVVELDSPTFHGGPGSFQSDREKDLVFRDAGFDVLRLTREHVVDEPARVVARVARELTLRAASA